MAVFYHHSLYLELLVDIINNKKSLPPHVFGRGGESVGGGGRMKWRKK